MTVSIKLNGLRCHHSAALEPTKRSPCIHKVRNESYRYRQWNNGCRETIGKGFRCFNLDDILIGGGSNATQSQDGTSHDETSKVPLFIKLHKVGGTTFGDLLHQAAEERVVRQVRGCEYRSCQWCQSGSHITDKVSVITASGVVVICCTTRTIL